MTAFQPPCPCHAFIHLDPDKILADQRAGAGHNRWHPDIQPAVRIASGATVEMHTIDGLDRQIRPDTTAADLASIDMGRIHPLTGPVYVEGAEAGDLLAIKIEAVNTADHGFTMVMPGFGFLREQFSTPCLVHWNLAGGFATSTDLPGVRIPAAPFMGVMGVAPSHDLLQRINLREAELLGRGGAVLLPDTTSAVPDDLAIASTGLRTIAPHETGGNIDIRQLTAGATLYLPVYQPGALFSAGDAHFAQGDGESCGTAIETSASFVATFELLKGEARRRNQRDPSFAYPGQAAMPASAAPRRYYATTGTSVHRDGSRNESESLTLAAQNALHNMIEHLVDTRGLTPVQAYCLTSVAVNLKVSQVVNVPNLIVSAVLPLDIFSS